MEKIRIAIIDDEASARQTLNGILQRFFPELTIIGEASSIKDGISFVENNQIDLLFLDIKMQNGTGFDLLKKIKSPHFGVIFITAYDQYAMDAFKFSAIDYLLKPIKISELREAIERYKVNRKSNVAQIHVLMDNLADSDKKIFRIVLPTTDGFIVEDVKNIVRLEGMRNYTQFFTSSGNKAVVPYTLKKYEDMFAEYGFLRIHISHLINMRHVIKYHKGNSGEVEMSDGSVLNISRQRKKHFLNYFLQT